MKDLKLTIHGLNDLDAVDVYDFFHSFLSIYESTRYVRSYCMTIDSYENVISSEVFLGSKEFGDFYE